MLIMAMLIIVLIILNGIYVAAEFAVISLPRPLLTQAAEQGNATAQRYLQVTSNSASQDRYIAVAQMGITLASLGLGMYGEHSLALWLEPKFIWLGGLAPATAHTVASVCALLFLTFWHIVLGEMVPKSLALSYPLRTGGAVWWPMRLSGWLLAPLGWVLNGIGNLLLRLLGLPVSQDMALVYSPAELRMVFDESRQGGELEPQQHLLLERVIDFGERPLRLVMVPAAQVVALPHDHTVEQVLAILAREEYSRYPIFEPDGNHFSGFVHVKDLFAALRRGELQRPVHELQHGLLRLSAAMPLGEALEQLRAKSAHMAVVADESGSLAGLVTVEDLIEELFGEIRDEFDAEEMPRLEAVGENRWRASGRVPLLDLEEAVGVRLQSSSPAETVAAYVLAGAGRVPREGERLELDELFITVERVQDNAVASCVVELRQLNS